MRKEDFKKGQRVVLYCTNGRSSAKMVLEERRILPAVVKSVGRKYITVSPENSCFDIQFDIENNFREKGNWPQYILFLNNEDVINEAKRIELQMDIKNFFNSRNVDNLSLTDLKRVYEIIKRGSL